MHSDFSPDCRYTLAEMCEGALARGLTEIGFTEHYDLHPDENPRDFFKLEPWAEALERCREQFRGRLTIRAGIEVGEPHLFAAEARAMLARYPFDYVIGSLHWVGRRSIFDDGFYRERPAAEAFRLYFEELERMTRLGGFDILGHFDVPVRTAAPIYQGYDPRDHEDAIRPVLKNCVERGIALDINTAALRRRAKRLTPGLEILGWYAELGGERVTLGSDAHQPGAVGQDLDAAMDAARAAGLKYVTQFEGRQARHVPLPA